MNKEEITDHQDKEDETNSYIYVMQFCSRQGVISSLGTLLCGTKDEDFRNKIIHLISSLEKKNAEIQDILISRGFMPDEKRFM